MVAGRTTEPRSVTVTTTSSSAAVTAAAGTFNPGDVGAAITAGAGIPAGTTIAAVASDTAATLSANATASGSRSATVTPAKGAYGFVGWSPESGAEAAAYTLAANNAGVIPPDRIQNTYTAAAQRGRG